MWVKQWHKPPTTANGNHTTYKHGDDWGMVKVALFYPHYPKWMVKFHGESPSKWDEISGGSPMT